LSGVVGILCLSTEGDQIEVGIVGREAGAGISPETERYTTGIVLVSGIFHTISREQLSAVAKSHPEVAELIRCCIQWQLLQAQRHALCQALHDAEMRIATWLLQMADRAGREIALTQEEIAQLLGLRRTTVTVIAQKLLANGTISYKRGLITINNRAGLEHHCCECHSALPPLGWTAEKIAASHTNLRSAVRPARSSARSDIT
jgi:CRP-like cAMP-binding protein